MQHPTRHPARRAGVSFVEVIIVVAIIAIAAALVVPRMGNTGATKLKAAAQLLVADLGFAQIESISHGDDPRLIVFDTAADTYHIAAASNPATPITDPVAKAPYRVTLGQGRAGQLDGVAISAIDLDGDNQLAFGVYGQLDQTAAATITLTADGQSITVTVDPVTGEAGIGQIN